MNTHPGSHSWWGGLCWVCNVLLVQMVLYGKMLTFSKKGKGWLGVNSSISLQNKPNIQQSCQKEKYNKRNQNSVLWCIIEWILCKKHSTFMASWVYRAIAVMCSWITYFYLALIQSEVLWWPCRTIAVPLCSYTTLILIPDCTYPGSSSLCVFHESTIG